MKRAPVPATGRLTLGFGGNQYSGVWWGGMLGTIPTTAWLAMVIVPLHLDDPGSPLAGLGQNSVAGVAVMLLSFTTILVAPWLVPCLVLRARQPHGARVEWDEKGVTEWDGAWKRAVVPWKTARAAHQVWKVTARMRTITFEAIQLVDRETGAAITVWPCEPPGAPTIRRRLCVDDAAPLRAAIDGQKLAMGDEFNASLAQEEHRRRSGWRLWVGRLGYVAGAIAPLEAGVSPAWGLAIATVATMCLMLRAVTVFAELRALVTSTPTDPGQQRAEQLRLRAVIVEALVRSACIALVPASTLASAFELGYAGE